MVFSVTDLALVLSVLALVVSGLALLFAIHEVCASRRVDKILSNIRRSEIAEKTAMMYGYAGDFQSFQTTSKIPEYFLARIRSDINAMKAIRELIKDEILTELRNAGEAMFKEMENKVSVNQITPLRTDFESLFS